MKAFAITRRNLRPISVRIPSEHYPSRTAQFRWWPIEIEPHRQLIAELQRTAARDAAKIREEWLDYLKNVEQKGVVTPPASQTAIAIWARISQKASRVRPPNSRATDDCGMRLSWNRGGTYLEILVRTDGTFEWFYTDTENGYGGEDDLTTSAPLDKLLARLSKLF